jgi:hypothetical protein
LNSVAAARAERPRYVAGTVAVIVGVSVANTLPGWMQGILYLIGLSATLARPHRAPVREAVVIALAALYVVLARMASSSELDGALRMLRPCFEGFVLAQVLFKWCGIRDMRSVAVVLGGFLAFQVLMAVAMALDPTSRSTFLDSLYADDAEQNPRLATAFLFRGYGISRHHLFGFPLACGLAAAILLISASLDKSTVRRIAAGAIAAAGLLLVAVNARIGFVPVVVCYLLGATLLFDRFYVKQFVVVTALLVVPILYLGIHYFGDDFETVWRWLGEGVGQFGADQPEVTTLSDLSKSFVFSSNPIEWIVGAGHACSGDQDCYSDIGFIRAMQEGGALLLLLLLYVYWRLNRYIVDLLVAARGPGGPRVRRAAQLLSAVVQITFIGAMVKGEAFAPSDYSRLVVTLACLGQLAGSATSARRAANRAAARIVGPVAGAGQPSPAL